MHIFCFAQSIWTDFFLSDLSQAVMSDVERVEHAMSHSIPKVAAFCLFFPLMSILMLVGNVKMGLAVIIPTLVSFLLIPLSGKNRVQANNKYFYVLRKNAESFQETIEMQQEISSYHLENQVRTCLYQQMEESERIHLKVEAGSVLVVGLSDFLSFISVGIVILVGIQLVLAKEISLLYLVGYFISALKIKELFDISKEGIMEVFFIFPAVHRIREMKNGKTQEGENIEIETFDVELKDVSFSYDKDTPVLEHVSFLAKQNQVTALVGASGSGKTSALRLISRLYDYDRGKILIGGRDIKEISTDSLFRYISIVFQDVTLFNTSVLENIRLGNLNASDEEVFRAAELANCTDFIRRLPNGIQTLIGENGAELSGGERQRISIARAFLKNAPILILDEISASLDVENEQKIQDSLNHLIENKTVIIISHRMKSIENVDQIVVMEDRKVESIGTHEELLKHSRVYQNLMEKTQMAENFIYS